MLKAMESLPGTWPTLRHDERLTGHQSLPGAIRDPAVRWRYRLPGPVFEGHLLVHDHGADVLLPFGGCLHRYSVHGHLVWKSPATGIESVIGVEDLDNDGRIEILATNGKSLFVFDADTGRVLWRTYLGPPTAGGFMQTAARTFRDARIGDATQLAVGLLSSKQVALYDFGAGADRPKLRRSLSMPDFFHPTLLLADIDRDGVSELVVTKLSSIYAFDTDTGELKSECRWSSGGTPKRNYGLLTAVDLDGAGAASFVVISDRVSRHIAMVSNDGGGGLSLSWDRFIEHIYDTDTTELRVVPRSCCDIDGDGRLEIVVSLFNADGDGRWWLEVIDAKDGHTRMRVPDLYLRGVAVAVDGTPRVYVSRESTRVPAAAGRIGLMKWGAVGLEHRTEVDNAAFVGSFVRPDATHAQFRTDLPPVDDVALVDVDSRRCALVQTAHDDLALMEDDGTLSEIAAGLRPAAVLAAGDMDGDGAIELVLSGTDGTVRIVRMDGSEVSRIDVGLRLRPGTGPYYGARPMSTPVVFRDGERRYCATPDAAGAVHVVYATPGGVRQAWSHPGRGRIGPEETFHSVVAAEFDGQPVVLFAAAGEAAVVACDAEGRELHRWPVPWLPPTEATPVARTGLHEYAVLDGALMVSGFLSWSMNSDQTWLIDAASGSVRWSRASVRVPGHELGFAPWNAVSVDRTEGDARLLFLAKDTLCEVDAETGRLEHAPWQLRSFNRAAFDEHGYSMDDFAAYGSLAVVDVDGDGAAEWVLLANYGGFGLIGRDHQMRWWRPAPLSSLTCAFAGIADVDSDGNLELGVPFADGDFVCIRASSGLELWRIHLGLTAVGVASCDIDGDGAVEFVVSTAEGALLAIGVSEVGTGVVKWRLDLGYALGAPVIADLDGSGRSQVLVVSGEGWLCSVGEASTRDNELL